MRKKASSTADIIGIARALLDGANQNKDDIVKFGLDMAALQGLLDQFQTEEAAQEKAKADLHSMSSRHRSSRKEIVGQFSRWVSILEGQYGRNSAKLEEFGIAPRQVRPKTGPRAQKPVPQPQVAPTPAA